MEQTYLMQVGERIRECRQRSGLSRKELAARSGVVLSVIVNLERGVDSINIEDATKLCKELNCSTEYILTGECGLAEFVWINQKILNLPYLDCENLKRLALAFWQNCPRLFR